MVSGLEPAVRVELVGISSSWQGVVFVEKLPSQQAAISVGWFCCVLGSSSKNVLEFILFTFSVIHKPFSIL